MNEAPLTVTLTANMPDARLAQLTRELERDLSRASIHTRPVEGLHVPGQRGEPVTLGVLLLALVTSNTVKALIDCFKAYLVRERALTIKFARTDGTHVEVTARNVDTPAVREAIEAIVSSESG
jgi:hypothetical protein